MTRIPRRDLRLGRWKGPTIDNDVAKRLGSALEAVGAAVVPGDPGPRTLKVSIPIHADRYDDDAKAVGDRMRRQIEALLENDDARQLLYLAFAADPELDAWVALGTADLSYVEGGAGPSLGEYQLEPDDVQRVGSQGRAREARRLEFVDRRLSTTPRDYRLERYEAVLTPTYNPLTVGVLPPGVSDVVGRFGGDVSTLPRRTAEGDVAVVPGVIAGEVLSFERDVRDQGLGDVVAYDRHGITAPPDEVEDTFVVASNLANYTIGPVASAANLSLNAAGLTVAGGGTAIAYRLQRNTVEYDDGALVTGVFLTGSTIANIEQSLELGLPLAGGDGAFVGVRVVLDDDGTTSRLRIVLVAPGGLTDTYSTDLAARLSTATRYYLSARIVAGRVRAEVRTVVGETPLASLLRDVDDAADDAPAGASAQMRTALAGEALRAGVRWTPRSATAKVEGLRVTPLRDRQRSSGWEELYGRAQRKPWGTESLVDFAPVLSNGIVRVRTIQPASGLVAAAIAVDAFVPGIGWREHGVVLPSSESAGATDLYLARTADLVEWTPERAVMRIAMGSVQARGELFVTLERGDLGPRFELYSRGPTGPLGAQLLFVPKVAGNHRFTSPEVTGGVPTWFRYEPEEGGGVWSRTTSGYMEPWLLYSPVTPDTLNPRGTALATLHQATAGGMAWRGIDDTAAYNATRKGAAVRAPTGSGSVGYVTLVVAPIRPTRTLEAETYRNTGSGSATQVADGAAIGGQAVQDTQTAQGTAAVIVPAATLDSLGIEVGSKCAIWLRVRAGTAGATVGYLARFASADSVAGAVNGNAYSWVLAGEYVRGVGDTIQVYIWRSFGTGVVLIDRIGIDTLERHGGTLALPYDGARDVGDRLLLESRNLPTLVDR